MADILHRVGINSPADKVFTALSDEKGLAGWWSKNIKASPVVGAVNQFRFGENGFNDMKVVELVPGKRVKWQCVDGAKEWIGTEVTFDLKEENGHGGAFCSARLERTDRIHALLQHQVGRIPPRAEIAVRNR